MTMTIFSPFISFSPHMHATLNTVPPDILDYPTSTGTYYMLVRLVRQIHYTVVFFSDMVVREGSNVTLKCAARGSPTPTITWRRENAEPIALSSAQEGKFLNARALAGGV